MQRVQGDLQSNQGVRSDSFINVDIISPILQKDILDGKDINLATLLIPFYDCPTKHSVVANGIEVNVTGKPDIRLNMRLSIQEFIRAFGKYKRVMTSVFDDRRTELDAYEDDIIDIHNSSVKNVTTTIKLSLLNLKFNCGRRRLKSIGVNAIDIYYHWFLLAHTLTHVDYAIWSVILQFCPLQTSKSYISTHIDDTSRNKRSDRYGKDICNNFNGNKGCTRANYFCSRLR